MQEAYGLSGFHIRLYKKIPIAAGMAGGSADAAGVIRGLNRLFDLGLSLEEMMQQGEKLGSDIPYCLLGGTCLATGARREVAAHCSYARNACCGGKR